MMMANGTFLTLSIYDKLPHSLLEVTADSEVSEEAYLALPNRKQVIYNEKNIITNLTKLTPCITMLIINLYHFISITNNLHNLLCPLSFLVPEF